MRQTLLYTTCLFLLNLTALAGDPPRGHSSQGNDSMYIHRASEFISAKESVSTQILDIFLQRSAILLDSIETFHPEKRDTFLVTPELAYSNDSLISKRLKMLSETRVVAMDYNPAVKEYIHAYAIENADKISRILGESQYYFPIFEEYLDRYNLPPELKYLASVESALDPNAVSKSGAVGLWQFLTGTAGLFDLEINAWIDERRDVYASTDAACRYLQYLYRIYGDWHLVLASYNGGPGAVQKAIARNGGNTNYWELRPGLSKQMQNYVPAFIAMNYVMAYYKDFNIEPEIPLFSRYDTDTVKIFSELSFEQISANLPVSDKEIQYLNPVFRKSVIPKSSEGYNLVLPRRDVIELILNFEKISGYKKPENTPEEDTIRPELSQIRVLPGDSFHKLAIRYHCMVEDILRWNDLNIKHKLQAGEFLLIRVNSEEQISEDIPSLFREDPHD